MIYSTPLTAIFLIVCLGFSVNLAFGHGLGGEMHPPTTIGDRDATLSIDISPSTFDPKDPENFITLKLFDSKMELLSEVDLYKNMAELI